MNHVSEFKLDYKAYAELCDRVEGKTLLRAVISSAVYLIASYELFRLGWIWTCAAMAVGYLVSQFMAVRRRRREYRNLIEANHGALPQLVSIADNDGLRTKNLNTGSHFEVPYDQIGSIGQSPSFFQAAAKDNKQCVIFHTRSMTEGDGAGLEARLTEGGQKIKRLWDSRWCYWPVRCISVLIIMACLVTGLGAAEFTGPLRQDAPAMDVQAAAAALEELGIDPPPEEALAELSGFGADSYTVLGVLSYAGMGEYDDETYEWTPARSGVYAFDIEVWDVGNMYTNFLRGVEAMSRGALEFTDITEDDSNVDLEDGSGWKEVTLTYEGRTRTFRAQMYSDWFDGGFANDLAEFVGEDTEGRRLRFLFDGYQEAFVFYCDEEWAEEFEDATGYALSTDLG